MCCPIPHLANSLFPADKTKTKILVLATPQARFLHRIGKLSQMPPVKQSVNNFHI